MSIETIRLSQRAKEILINMKRPTGISNWNVLCRWALCLSLAEPTPPPRLDSEPTSNVEMTWKTFGGEFARVYRTVLMLRYHQETQTSEEKTSLQDYLQRHLSRGIGYLAAKKVENIKELAALSVK